MLVRLLGLNLVLFCLLRNKHMKAVPRYSMYSLGKFSSGCQVEIPGISYRSIFLKKSLAAAQLLPHWSDHAGILDGQTNTWRTRHFHNQQENHWRPSWGFVTADWTPNSVMKCIWSMSRLSRTPLWYGVGWGLGASRLCCRKRESKNMRRYILMKIDDIPANLLDTFVLQKEMGLHSTF